MDHQDYIDSVLYWLDKKRYYVDFCENGDDAVDRISKVISINTTRSLETQLHILLHECGHILVMENDKITNGSDEVLNKYGKNTNIYKVFTVIEEIEAWKRGLKLANKLFIPIDKTKWNRDVARAIKKYMQWALGVEGY